MDDHRFPPSQEPSQQPWSLDDLLALNAGQQFPGPHTRQRSQSMSTSRHRSHYPPADAMPNLSQLDLLAALAHNPALAAPLQTGRETDFNHALLDALRILTANAHAAQAAGAQPPQSQQQPYFLPGQPQLPPIQPSPHTSQLPPVAGPSTAPPIDPLLYWLQQNMQAGGQAQGSSSGIAQKDATQNPPQAGVPITNTARGRTRSIVAGRRTSSSAPASPNVDRADALDAEHLPPHQPAVDPEDPGALEEDKRRRNTAASARFRAKKKQQVVNLERTISDLTSRADELEREASDLRRENGWLKEIVMLKGRALSGQGITPPDSTRDPNRYQDRP